MKKKIDSETIIVRMLLAALCVMAVLHAFRIDTNEANIKAIEKVLKGGKYICSVKRKIIKTHINCDLLKNTQEQDNATN